MPASRPAKRAQLGNRPKKKMPRKKKRNPFLWGTSKGGKGVYFPAGFGLKFKILGFFHELSHLKFMAIFKIAPFLHSPLFKLLDEESR